MKATINGFRFDTEKALKIGSAVSVFSVFDYQYWEATLYVTPRKKVYFLAGKGGKMTMWSRKWEDGSWSGGEGIKTLTPKEAFDWAERFLHAEEIEKFFPKGTKTL